MLRYFRITLNNKYKRNIFCPLFIVCWIFSSGQIHNLNVTRVTNKAFFALLKNHLGCNFGSNFFQKHEMLQFFVSISKTYFKLLMNDTQFTNESMDLWSRFNIFFRIFIVNLHKISFGIAWGAKMDILLCLLDWFTFAIKLRLQYFPTLYEYMWFSDVR